MTQALLNWDTGIFFVSFHFLYSPVYRWTFSLHHLKTLVCVLSIIDCNFVLVYFEKANSPIFLRIRPLFFFVCFVLVVLLHLHRICDYQKYNKY
jgi:hypothetical protein